MCGGPAEFAGEGSAFLVPFFRRMAKKSTREREIHELREYCHHQR